ncbi:cyclin-dependent protein kinase inhibitor SMR3 [Prunus yedoensis var. nudiflora]|uniref:Cyclin-dependent protein kinase inhibitor SMR3 n=1 Tax=Prunus yedoensis var. nudiflora TaxID=2094558 RepID=A0A314YJS1_PRUYE|nr:cyclin-dependent protein kinase inhibitor SMR3 [Prunus yedoensis var. nudiflora]
MPACAKKTAAEEKGGDVIVAQSQKDPIPIRHLDTKELEAFFASNFLLQDLRAKIKKAKQAHRDETR